MVVDAGREVDGFVDVDGAVDVGAVDDGLFEVDEGSDVMVEVITVVATVTVAGPRFWGMAEERSGRARRNMVESMVNREEWAKR